MHWYRVGPPSLGMAGVVYVLPRAVEEESSIPTVAPELLVFQYQSPSAALPVSHAGSTPRRPTFGGQECG